MVAAFTPLYLAGLLIVPAVAEFLQCTFLVHLLLQTTEGAFDRLTFTAFYVGHFFFTPFFVCSGVQVLHLPQHHCGARKKQRYYTQEHLFFKLKTHILLCAINRGQKLFI